MFNITKTHAVVLDLGEYGQGLVYLDQDDNGILKCRYRMWLDDDRCADFSVSMPEGASDEAIDNWESMQTDLIKSVKPDNFIAAAKAIGIIT